MRDMIISSSVLILAILLLRQCIKERVSPLFQYMIWLPVALRLMFPFPLWSSSVSIMNLFPQTEDFEVLEERRETFEGQTKLQEGIEPQNQMEFFQNQREEAGQIESFQSKEKEMKKAESGQGGNGASFVQFAVSLWIFGAFTVGGYMLFYQIKWKRFLRENQKPLEGLKKYRNVLHVYTVEGLPSPCLSGRNIYLTEKMAANEKQLSHILVHEYCHYRHMDSLWVIVRCVLTAVYWFHPLVWAAAYVSKQDSEFACDEAAIRLLGEEERFAYGRTLIQLISDNSYDKSKMGIASTMSGGEKGIRERICRIAKKPKNLFLMAGVAGGLVIVLIAITFSGAEQKKDMYSEQGEGSLNNPVVEAQLEDEAKGAVTGQRIQKESEKQTEDLLFMEKLRSFEGDLPDVNMQTYYEEGEKILEEGFYLLEKSEELEQYAVSVYGFYTKEYGFRGIKLLIGEEVNYYDLPWLISGLDGRQGNLSIYGLHESSGDGTPRTFALKMLSENTSNSEVWRLYIGDRDDTGTVVLSEFTIHDCMAQIEERLSFKIAESENKIYVYDNKKMVGAVEVPEAEGITGKIEEVVFNGNCIGWELGYTEKEVRLIIAIGLQLENEEEIWYRGLNLISFPVECGSFGSRIFELGQAKIEMNLINGMVQELSAMYTNPCPSYTRISDSFGSRIHPVTGKEKVHEGVDMVAKEGADILAAAGGEVYQTGFNIQEGNYVILYHKDYGSYTHYSGCKEILVAEGEQVALGDKIATVGQTGMSTGPHLHFAVSVDGEFVEPVLSDVLTQTLYNLNSIYLFSVL